MKIHYLNKSKKPKVGDLKVMKDGNKFIRHFKIIDSMRCNDQIEIVAVSKLELIG